MVKSVLLSPVALMLSNMITQTREDGLVIAFGMSVGLWMECSDREMSQLKYCAKGLKEFAHDLLTVVCEHERGNALYYDQIVEDNR